MTLNTPLSGACMCTSPYLPAHEIWSAYSFTDSKDMIADEILKNGSRDPDHAH